MILRSVHLKYESAFKSADESRASSKNVRWHRRPVL